ncbi:hypothetical protein M231_07526 [Tremella mesenterica]|uniref:Uncharacterized protein n=1 Tax=Tremella mesenterica TaxID=5217 RepID=A0A4Q1BFR5_TREME|nr:hypothetical protein M231_07526 [Tremella mesenterica]
MADKQARFQLWFSIIVLDHSLLIHDFHKHPSTKRTINLRASSTTAHIDLLYDGSYHVRVSYLSRPIMSRRAPQLLNALIEADTLRRDSVTVTNVHDGRENPRNPSTVPFDKA